MIFFKKKFVYNCRTVKRAKYFNVPIPMFDEMEFVFTGKHDTGEFSVLQVAFDRPARQGEDLDIGNVKQSEVVNLDVDPCQYYDSDSDTLPEYDSPTSVGSKRAKQSEETMHFTHVTDPNESIYKASDDMEEYLVLVCLDMQTYLAENHHIASMLKGRP
jgi:hypothetical protein